MLIGTFATIPLTNTEDEVGVMESELHLDPKVIEASGSPKAFVMQAIALHLRGVMERTSTPMEIWDFSPTRQVRNLTGLPESVPFR